LQIIATYELHPEKETPGCHRYHQEGGDAGVQTIYLRKDALNGQPAPRRLSMTLTAIPEHN